MPCNVSLGSFWKARKGDNRSSVCLLVYVQTKGFGMDAPWLSASLACKLFIFPVFKSSGQVSCREGYRYQKRATPGRGLHAWGPGHNIDSVSARINPISIQTLRPSQSQAPFAQNLVSLPESLSIISLFIVINFTHGAIICNTFFREAVRRPSWAREDVAADRETLSTVRARSSYKSTSHQDMQDTLNRHIGYILSLP